MILLQEHTQSCLDKPVIADRIYMPNEITPMDVQEMFNISDEVHFSKPKDSGCYNRAPHTVEIISEEEMKEALGKSKHGFMDIGFDTFCFDGVYQILNELF